MTELFESGSITVWEDVLEGEHMVTVRIGMTTIQMPKSIFLELHGGVTEAMKRMSDSEHLT